MIKEIKKIIDEQVTKLNEEERAGRTDNKKREYFYASDAGACPRKLFFDFKGVESEPLSPKTLRIFANGNDVHNRLTKYFEKAGVLVDTEMDIPRDELDIHGRYDGKIKIGDEEIVVEFKSINLRTVNQPMEHHVEQLQLYLHYLGLKKGILVYESKQTQEIFAFEIIHDEDQATKITDWFKWVKEKIDKDELPTKPTKYTWNKYPCSYCGRLEHCKFLATGEQ